jgi:hypothetical protein
LVLVGEVSNVNELASILGSSFPMKYLGFLVGAYFKVKFILDDIIKKMECWLVGWKIMHLFKDERITLIKSTFYLMSTYFMSLFPLPVGVTIRIRKL